MEIFRKNIVFRDYRLWMKNNKDSCGIMKVLCFVDRKL